MGADMKAWQIVSDGGVDALHLNDGASPEPGPGQVLVRMRASSINYRDLSTIEDPIPRHLPFPTVPNSDGAGEILAAGAGVEGLKPGDRVASCFFQDWPAGPITPTTMASALGGARQGVLAEEVVLEAGGVVPFPDHLSFSEAATLPCARVDRVACSDNAVAGHCRRDVLLLGTGGVSVFAPQFCRIMGARTIVTSSSDEKLERMRALGAGDTINYRKNPDWEKAVLDLTGGTGVDRVVEVGGPGTLEKSIASVKVGGIVGLIGILTGVSGQVSPTSIMRKSITVRGIMSARVPCVRR